MDIKVGDVVEASHGEWANEPTSFEYQWYLDDVAVEGENSNVFTIPDNIGSYVKVGVKATNSEGTSDYAFSESQIIKSQYDPYVQAIFDRMDSPFNTDDKNFVNYWYSIAEPYLNKWDYFYFYGVRELGQCLENGRLLNWAESGSIYNGTLNGAVDFIPNSGLKGNGTDFWIETNFLPTVNTKYQQNSATVGGSANTGVALHILYGGPGVVGSTQLSVASGFNQSRGGTNLGGTRVYTNDPVPIEHHALTTRLPDNQLRTYVNSIQRDSVSSAPTDPKIWTIGSFPLYCRYVASDNSRDSYSSHRGACSWAGSGMTAEEVYEWYYILNELLAYFGVEEKKEKPNAFAKIDISPLNISQNDEVTYSITLEDGVFPGSLDIEVSGIGDGSFNESFVSSLQSSVDLTDGVSFDGVKTLTFDDSFSGTLSWSRALTSSLSIGTPHTVQLTASSGLKLRKPYSSAIYGNLLGEMPPQLFGVNLAGAEFGGFAFYQTANTVDYYMDKGFRIFRIPMNWERLQPILFGPLDNASVTSYKIAVNRVLERGGYVIIDPHDYGGRNVNGVSRKIGDEQLPVMAFLDWWNKLIDALDPSDNYIYCLNNEPAGISSEAWWSAAQALTEYIRSKGDYSHIQVPGIGYSTASQWITSGNSGYAENFIDPANNCSFDVHQYLDPASNGSTGVCTIGANNRINDAINWAEENNKYLFFGEIGAGNPDIPEYAQCGTEFPDTLDKIQNSPYSLGVTGWSGGQNWTSGYHFRLEPPNRDIEPEVETLTILKSYLPD